MKQARFQRKFSSWAGFDECTRTVGIHLSRHSGQVTLVDSVLLADEMGRMAYGKGEELNQFIWAKKQVYLKRAECKSAQLMCYLYQHVGNSSPCYIDVNGYTLEIPQDVGRQGWYMWYAVDVPRQYLIPGRNEFVCRANGSCFDAWKLGIENGNLTGRSTKSEDGGKTWRSELMGYDNSQLGEYLVRLRLGSHAEEGVITSPVVDLSLSEGNISNRIHGGLLIVDIDSLTPLGTSTGLELRRGNSVTAVNGEWTEWQTIESGEAIALENAPFVQWRAILTSSQLLTSPVLKEVSLSGFVELADSRPVGQIQVEELDNADMPSSSFEFKYQDTAEPRLDILRQREGLDEVVAGATSEFEQLRLLRTWVSKQWRYMHGKPYYAPWDALVILDWVRRLGTETRAGCMHYAVVFCQCCLALGRQARLIVLAQHRTLHTDGHFVAEVWSNEHRKWVVMDANLDIHYAKDGVPLNALELHRIWSQGHADRVYQIAGDGNVDHPLGSDWALEQYRAGLYRYWGLVLRNDYLTSLGPWPIDHGWGTYRWNGFLWWGGDIPSQLPQFALYSDREADFYWSENSVHIRLERQEEEGIVNVKLVMAMPNFDGFEVRGEGGEWQTQNSSFPWVLYPGTNSLEAQARNKLGVHGPISRVQVIYQPGYSQNTEPL